MPLAMSLAAKADHSEISIDDVKLEMGRTKFQLQQELARTGAIVAAGEGAQMQGQAAMLKATEWHPAPLPVPLPMPAPTINTTCDRIGTTTYCNSP
jgi:hypothetical protein